MVAATNQPLEQAVHEGTFRRDLFFRLQVVEIRVPPLRERTSDVPLLAEHFLKRFVRETGRKIRGFTPAALQKMEEYHWPGNVRELRNVVERAVALGSGPMLDAADIWLSSLEAGGAGRAERRRRLRAAVAGGDREAAHPADAGAHRLEQEPGGGDPQHRALDAGSQDQDVRSEAQGCEGDLSGGGPVW